MTCSPSSQDIRNLTPNSDQFVSPILTLHTCKQLTADQDQVVQDDMYIFFPFAMQRSPALFILLLGPCDAGGTVLGGRGQKSFFLWKPGTCFVVWQVF